MILFDIPERSGLTIFTLFRGVESIRTWLEFYWDTFSTSPTADSDSIKYVRLSTFTYIFVSWLGDQLLKLISNFHLRSQLSSLQLLLKGLKLNFVICFIGLSKALISRLNGVILLITINMPALKYL